MSAFHFAALQLEATTAVPAEVARGKGYRVFAVRWPVFDDVEAEGLLLEPEGPPRARIVAIPDAGWSSEGPMFVFVPKSSNERWMS
jgi:hypothetical protein